VQKQYGDQCPLQYNSVYDGGGDLAISNGIVYVHSGNTTQRYESFFEFIDFYNDYLGWVFDRETGEGRYYDGSENGNEDACWTPMQMAIGRVLDYKPMISRSVTEIPQIGGQKAAALKANRISNNLVLSKVWIDVPSVPIVQKAPDRSRTIPLYHQYNFRGEGVVNVNEFVKTLKQDYHLVILYAMDLSSDSDVVAKTWIAPCTMFEEVSISASAGAPVNARMTGVATYVVDLPTDKDNIGVYEYSLTGP